MLGHEAATMLRHARNLIDTPEKLSSEVLTSQDAEGNSVELNDSAAVRHCIGNAIELACLQNSPWDLQRVNMVHYMYFQHGLFKYMPVKLTDHASVLKTFDDAIETLDGLYRDADIQFQCDKIAQQFKRHRKSA